MPEPKRPMNIRQHAEDAAQRICGGLGLSPSTEELAGIADTIEKAIVVNVLEARNRCAGVAMKQSAKEHDLAHQISQKIRRANEVLVANLSSLR